MLRIGSIALLVAVTVGSASCPNVEPCTQDCGGSGGGAGGHPESGGGAGGAMAGGSGGGSVGGGGVGGGESQCAGTLTMCGEKCLDTAVDILHCGACGVTCGNGEVCNRTKCEPLPTDCVEAGACAPGFYCEPTLRKCIPGCRLPSDCGSGATCDSLKCSCAKGSHFCGEACVSNDSPSSCGERCMACPSPPNGIATCSQGTCGTQCNVGYVLCEKTCIQCNPPENAAAVCSGRECGFQCFAGFHLCGDKCLPDTSVSSCGKSCTPCPSVANATATCSNFGACGFTCNSGYERLGDACVFQSTWVKKGDSGFAGGAMVYDSVGGQMLMLAGNLMRWDGQKWVIASTGGPGITSAAAYDEKRKRLVAMDSDYIVWEWDGANWTEIEPKDGPGKIWNYAMAYDRVGGRVLLFGGERMAFFELSESTWSWDGSSWVHVPVTGPRPPGRYNHALATDSRRNRIVLFGGENRTSKLGDTWEWDGAKWIELKPKGDLPSRTQHAMAFDTRRERVVLFGGKQEDFLNGTWEWDGSNWSLRSPTVSPEARARHRLGYDSQTGQMLLYGGVDAAKTYVDTWLLETP